MTHPTFSDQLPIPGLVTRHCRHGRLCHYADDKVIGASLEHYGEWAEEELFLLHHFLRPGSWAVDVGANVGTHALAFSRFVSGEGRVLALEGNRRAFPLLCLNMMLNGARQVCCQQTFVGKESRLAFITDETGTYDDTNLGAFNLALVLTEENVSETQARFPVPIIRLDDLNLPRCDLIKIDVEGMELDVLEGARETIERHHPVIYYEQTSIHLFQETAAFLRERAYTLFWHVANPFNRNNFAGKAENIFGPTRETNVLALPSDYRGTPAPAGTAVHVIRGTEYDPPEPSPSEAGWQLPAAAYGES